MVVFNNDSYFSVDPPDIPIDPHILLVEFLASEWTFLWFFGTMLTDIGFRKSLMLALEITLEKLIKSFYLYKWFCNCI